MSTFPPIKPRDARLTLDVVRDAIQHNPTILLVTGRTMGGTTVRYHTLLPAELDTAFASHFFYLDDSVPSTRIMMVPFSLNGDV